MDDKSFNIRVPKRWVRVAMIVGVTALIVAPLTAIASHSFTDVPNSNTFHDDIAWLAEAEVTKGCNPPDNTEFCPDDNVTRGQMAAFMNRFAGYIGATDGIPAQADNATTADNATNAANATNADDADTVDGKHASAFLSAGDVEIKQRGPYTINHNVGGSIAGLEHYTDVTRVATTASGTVILQIDLSGPESIGDGTYGLKSIETCYRVTPGDSISLTRIRDGVTIIQTDTTDRAATSRACYTVTVDSPTVPTDGLRAAYHFSASASGDDLDIYGVTSTWTPTTNTLAASEGEVDDNTTAPAE